MKWTRNTHGHYVAGDYELIPVGFRRRREGYVVHLRGAHIDSCPSLVRAKARAERHQTKLDRAKIRRAPVLPGGVTAENARAQMRVLIAQETGKSPFDPSVVLEAKRRVARQSITPAYANPLTLVVATLPAIHGEARFGDRKVFIAALWDRVGNKIDMTLPEFKRWLIEQHHQRRLVLARADLIAAMPYDLVIRSETKTEGDSSGASFHFVVDPTIGGRH